MKKKKIGQGAPGKIPRSSSPVPVFDRAMDDLPLVGSRSTRSLPRLRMDKRTPRPHSSLSPWTLLSPELPQ